MIQNFNTLLLNLVKNNVFGMTSNARYCPVCGYLGEFQSVDSKKNTVCPECKSTERARLYYLYLMTIGLGKEKTKLVHVMPEVSVRYKINHMENVEYLPAGLDELSKVFGNNAKYDLIMANYILDRVENPVLFLNQVKKSLSSKGIAMLSVHIHEVEDLGAYPRKYSEKVIDLITKAGLEVKLISAAGLCGIPLAVLCAIPENEYILEVKKK